MNTEAIITAKYAAVVTRGWLGNCPEIRDEEEPRGSQNGPTTGGGRGCRDILPCSVREAENKIYLGPELREESEGAYIPSGKCKGLCTDTGQRYIAFNIVIDRTKYHMLPVADKDVGKDRSLRNIPI